MSLTLRPGPVSARWVYRRLRAALLANARCDLVIRVIRIPDVPGFDRYPATVGAVDALDLVCKVLDDAPILRLRTRYWHGCSTLPRARQAHHHGLRRGVWRRFYVDHGDRWYGLRYARLVARLLRAAHREGVPLMVVVG